MSYRTLKLNEAAEIHFLTINESERLFKLYSKFLNEIEWLLKKADIPIKDNWLPSADFKCLMKIHKEGD